MKGSKGCKAASKQSHVVTIQEESMGRGLYQIGQESNAVRGGRKKDRAVLGDAMKGETESVRIFGP